MSVGIQTLTRWGKPVVILSAPFQRWDYDANNNCIYHGENQFTFDGADLRWKLEQMTYTSSNVTLLKTKIDGVWDSRTTAAYWT